ncbi:TetR/AcrR family transcriptional regulator [Phytomonospora endophytica]|uniref:AcrR family transcriptional regulator n=1 Tax=Phytomonospora endophytica TaxID=714109 RepID=A0A841FZG8_9ACTN|nr:TetR/AcrR family transcriptional regulator [Phytomonospora endophytica]MBB6038767.1 AcrR family transcriptional regulator [Phytomonospora endophytica]GIG68437.1 TetR family transcriptional regulator [Phytomonospora endophytica]
MSSTPPHLPTPAALLRLAADQGPPIDGAAGELFPPRVTATGTMRRLLAEALRQFAARGFHAVSVRDLAGAVGIHPSTVYAHVKSKEDLLAELIRHGHDEHLERLTLALEAVGEDPLDRLSALVGAHVRLHAEYPLLARVCSRELEALTGDRRRQAYAMRVRAEEFFLDVVVRGQRAGLFRDCEPLLAVTALGSMGIRVAEWWRPEFGVGVDQLVDTYTAFARRMLA